MEAKWDALYNLLSMGTYPSGFDKGKRQTLRRFASKFNIKDGDLYYGKRRVIKTKQEARMLFEGLHSPLFGGHMGLNKTGSAISAEFYWYGMIVDIAKWIQECETCRKSQKVVTNVELAQGLTPYRRKNVSQCGGHPVPLGVSIPGSLGSGNFGQELSVWDIVWTDLIGPIPQTVDGFQYIFLATDYLSKWVEAFPVKTKNPMELTRHLSSLIYRHGCPQNILFDQGEEFVNEINLKLCELEHIHRRAIAAHHPQATEVDKPTSTKIKQALQNLVVTHETDWDVYLDATLFTLRTKVYSGKKRTPFFLMYRREVVCPGETVEQHNDTVV